jgi:acetyltransferase-like isoleucine patch superfamily enzyme
MKYLLSQLAGYLQLVFFFRFNKIEYWRSIGVKIGDNCQILLPLAGFGSEPWLIEIESNVTIAPNVAFVTHDASSRLFRRKYPQMNQTFGNAFGVIKILNNSFIGINSTILPNVIIGPNAIVGAGSVVTKSVSQNTVVAGNPAKFICKMDNFIEKTCANLTPINAENRTELRRELTQYFWKEYR